MKGDNNDRNKVIVGAVIGGLLTGTAYYLWRNQGREKPILDKVGRAISSVGDKLEHVTVENRKEAIDKIGKSLPKENRTANHVLTLIATGINLWEQFKK